MLAVKSAIFGYLSTGAAARSDVHQMLAQPSRAASAKMAKPLPYLVSGATASDASEAAAESSRNAAQLR